MDLFSAFREDRDPRTMLLWRELSSLCAKVPISSGRTLKIPAARLGWVDDRPDRRMTQSGHASVDLTHLRAPGLHHLVGLHRPLSSDSEMAAWQSPSASKSLNVLESRKQ